MVPVSTERKLQFFNELMNNSNVAILVADKDRRNIFVNQKTCDMFGYKEEELIGKFSKIFHVSQESSQRFAELVLDKLLKGERVAIDYQWKKKDGTIFWGHISGSIQKDTQEVLWTLFDVTDRKEAEAIQLKNRQQAQIIQQINEAVVVIDLNGIITSWNNGATRLSGYKSSEIVGQHISKLYHKEDLQEFQSGIEELKRTGSLKRERTLIKKDGSDIEILLSSSLLKNEHGEITHLIGYAQDITLIKEAQNKILHADMFYALVESAFIAIYVIYKGKFIYTNKKFQALFGYTEKELYNKHSNDLIHPDDIELVSNNFKKREASVGLGIEYTFRGLKKSGEILDAHVYGSSLMLNNTDKAIIGTLTDETEKNLAKKQLESLASRDTLTDLYNRNYFNTQLTRAINLAQRHNHQLALIIFDIDNFKRVNDSLGHLSGDYIIQQTAKRISKILRDSDTFCRIGGDEFTIIVENYKSTQELTRLIYRIKEQMDQSIKIEEIAFHISLSIGISLYPKNSTSAVGLQKTADLAMYKAKSNGKNDFVFYNSIDAKEVDKIALEDELFQAYANKHFELHLQAQLCSKEEILLGAEALIRWKHPTQGLIAPNTFLSLAEDVGLLYKLDLFMLEKTFELLHKYNKMKLLNFSISVNISNALFVHQNFIPSIKKLASKYKEEIQYMELELTENITMKNEEYSKKTIKILKDLGFTIAIDDFGTGYSSLSHLKILGIDGLKIDKSFIDEISTNQTDKSIVKAIVDISKALSLKSVAEGVENKEQLDILTNMGCTLIQGYYFSKPLDIDQFEEKWLNIKLC